MSLGKITGQEIKKNRDGDTEKLMLQVQISNPEDIQTIEFMSQSGEDTNPPTESRVAILNISESYKIAIASDDGIVPSMAVGEKKLYSINNGVIAAVINLLANGNIEINGNADFAVRYNALETAFNQLLSDFNTHTHVSVTSLATPTPPVIPSTADITPAKVDEVTLP